MPERHCYIILAFKPCKRFSACEYAGSSATVRALKQCNARGRMAPPQWGAGTAKLGASHSVEYSRDAGKFGGCTIVTAALLYTPPRQLLMALQSLEF